MDSQELIESLANYLDIETEYIVQSSFNPNLFKVDSGEEWLLYETKDDAEDAAVEQIKQKLESEGISFLNWDCICVDIRAFVDVNWFDTAKRESYEQYVEDIRHEWADDEKTRLETEMEEAGCDTKEDYINYLCNNWPDSIEWFKSNFGDSELDEVVKSHPEIIDLNKLAECVVNTDGEASILASYDGEEIELDNCYAYRVN